MSAATYTAPPPPVAGPLSTRDKRLVRRLVTRAEEAFGTGDRIDFETFAAAAAYRLGVDGHGLDRGQLMHALRSALVTFGALALAVLLAACAVHSDLEQEPAPAAAPCASVDAGPDASPDAARVQTPPVPRFDGGAACQGSGAPLLLDTASPAQVSTAGGELVTLTGSGFCTLVDLEVNAESVPFAVVDDDHLVFTTPDESVHGPGPLQVVAYASETDTATIELTAVSP